MHGNFFTPNIVPTMTNAESELILAIQHLQNNEALRGYLSETDNAILNVLLDKIHDEWRRHHYVELSGEDDRDYIDNLDERAAR